MFGLQPAHLVIIFVAVLILFGPRQLPELGKGFGRAIQEFKQATRQVTDSTQPPESRPSDERSK